MPSASGRCIECEYKGPLAAGVALDTNLFVAAGCNPRSRAARILAAVGAGELALVWNVGQGGSNSLQ